jgi:hypothetical protein
LLCEIALLAQLFASWQSSTARCASAHKEGNTVVIFVCSCCPKLETTRPTSNLRVSKGPANPKGKANTTSEAKPASLLNTAGTRRSRLRA